jgi:hypothetical protein
MPSHGSELTMQVGMSTTCHTTKAATLLHPPFDANNTPLDGHVRRASYVPLQVSRATSNRSNPTGTEPG